MAGVSFDTGVLVALAGHFRSPRVVSL